MLLNSNHKKRILLMGFNTIEINLVLFIYWCDIIAHGLSHRPAQLPWHTHSSLLAGDDGNVVGFADQLFLGIAGNDGDRVIQLHRPPRPVLLLFLLPGPATLTLVNIRSHPTCLT